jgi:ornithine--oxo-acid transaminase
MSAIDYIAIEERYGAHNYKPLDIVLTHGQGVWVYDVDGRRYMDCLAGYSALNQGHCHPRIAHAAIEQAARLTLTSRAFRNDQLPRLYEKLHTLTGYDSALPMNSGAEAVETALKAARKWGYTRKEIAPDAAEIIVCANNFHGRTTTIVSFSTDQQYREGFGPFTPGFRVVPFGDARALRAAITPNTCAFLVEPIQGEAGIIVPPAGYLQEAWQICQSNRVLFIADEIQSGLGRAGRLFAHMWEDVRPDAVIVGKALGGGFYPISAVLASAEVLGVFAPGDHGSTFGGNPLACAIACAALDVIVDEHLCERSDQLGTGARERLRAIGRNSRVVRDVRGRGLWIGIELDRPARPFCEALMGEGLLCKETHERVIRFSPPLVITPDELDWALLRLERVLMSEIKEDQPWTASAH